MAETLPDTTEPPPEESPAGDEWIPEDVPRVETPAPPRPRQPIDRRHVYVPGDVRCGAGRGCT
jgi:hypothetical protein